MPEENNLWRWKSKIIELERKVKRLEPLIRKHVLTNMQIKYLYLSEVKNMSNREIAKNLMVTEQRVSNIKARLRQLGIIE